MQAFSEAVRAVYDAALVPENWPGALSRIGELFDAEGAVVIFYSRDGGTDFIYSEGLRDAVRLYQEESWWERDLHAQRAQAAHLTVGDVFDDFSVATPQEIATHPIFVDFFERVGFGWLMSCVVLPDRDRLVALSVPRAKAGGAFTEEERQRLALVGRHVEQALRLSLRLADIEATATALRAALDRIDVGILLLDAQHRLVFANTCGQSQLAELFDLADGRPRPRSESERLRFEALLAAAGSAEPEKGPPRSCMLTGADGRRAALWALPVTEAGQLRFGVHDPASTLLLMAPVDRDHMIDPVVLRDLFDLTLGEARLAALIGAGFEVRGAARRLGIAEGTVRTVLKRVFRKLGVNRQAELVLQLARMAGVTVAGQTSTSTSGTDAGPRPRQLTARQLLARQGAPAKSPKG